MDKKFSLQATKRFSEFIEKSKSLLHESKHIESPLSEFRSFAEKARAVVTDNIRQALLDPAVKTRFRSLSRWLLHPSMDILERIGIAELEDKYTSLIGWMLYPPGRPDLALRVQKSWLSALGLPFAPGIEQPAEVEEQIVTKEGRPDIVLRYLRPEHTVIVEAKINTPEHDTPERAPQTLSYPSSIRKHLGLPLDHEITMLFLTADNQMAKNPEAISTSYEVLLNSIASELSPSELSFDLRAPYSIIITHIFSYAALRNVDKAARLEAVKHLLLDASPALDDATILRELGILGPFTRMLMEGE